jgi:ketosteroid isomerase-like protein
MVPPVGSRPTGARHSEPPSTTKVKASLSYDPVQAKDFDRVLDFYRDDCVGMFTGLPVSVGKSSIGDIWRRVLSRSALNLHWKPTHIELARSGDLAYDFGSMTLTYVDVQYNK